MKEFIERVSGDFPEFLFRPGKKFSWAPSKSEIIYVALEQEEDSLWSLLHELAHAVLDHKGYETDFELLLMEAEAWHKACELAQKYDIVIDEDHIQDCLDSYRDWLYVRSTCPVCSSAGLQRNAREYRCFNCQQSWRVTHSRFSRPYRLKQKPALG